MTESAAPETTSPLPPPSPRLVRNRWIIFGLVALTLVVYWPVGRFDYINYDDPRYLTENPEVANGLTLDSARQALFSTQGGYRHPLTWWSHQLDVTLFGLDNPGGHHNVNLILHTINVVLLWWVMLRLTGAAWPSAWVAAILAVHPTHLESVAWISERKDVLSLLFMLLTIWAYQVYTEQRTLGRYAVVMLAFLAALMAKPMMVPLPAVLLLLDLWPLRRIKPGADARRAFVRCLVEKLPLFALSAVSAAVTIYDARSIESLATFERFSLPFRLQTSIIGYARYVGQMLWPVNLSIFYPYPLNGWPLTWVIGSAVLFAGVTALTVMHVRKRPYLLAGWLFFVIMLLPIIGLLPSGDASLADRYTYASSIGFCFALAWLVRELTRRTGGRQVATALGVATVVACAGLSMRGVWHWRDSLSIMGHALAVTKDNWTAELNYAAALNEADREDEAIAHAKAAQRLNPGGLHAKLLLADLYIKRQDFASAAPLVRAALAEFRDSPRTVATACRYLIGQGHHREAQQLARECLEKTNALQSLDVRVLLAASLVTTGQIDEGEKQYQLITEIRPSGVIYHRLGLIALSRNDAVEAERLFRQAIGIQPNLGLAHLDLGIMLARMGRFDEAERELNVAVKALPAHQLATRGKAELTLGQVLARLQRGPESAGHIDQGLQLLQDAVKQTPNDPVARWQQVSALQSLRRTDEARAAATAALPIAEAAGNAYVVTQLKAILNPATQPATTQSTQPHAP